MTGFWDEQLKYHQALIIDAKTEQTINYAELNQAVDAFIQQLPDSKALYAIEAANSLPVLIAYLALIRANQCLMLLDANTPDSQQQALLETYQVDYLIKIDSESDLSNCLSINQTRYYSQKPIHPDIVLLLSTSGSTASPKLVKLSQKNLQANCLSILDYLPIQATDTVVTSLPMHYSFGLSVINTHLQQGASLVLNDYNLMQKDFWQLVKTYQPAGFYGVPFSFQLIYQLGLKRLALHAYRYFAQAGGKMAVELTKSIDAWCKSQGKSLYLMYGQTEATARIAYLAPEKLPLKADRIGGAIPGGQLKLIDENGQAISQIHTSGQLCYQGENVSLGLATDRYCLSQIEPVDWLKTGDLAEVDADGDYKIVGRLKRFIKVTGKRVNLDEAEQIFIKILKKQKLEAPACVIGEDDQIMFVYAGSLSDDLTQTLAKELADTLQTNLKYIQLVAHISLPYLGNGKLDYKGLKNQIWASLN